MVTRHCIAKPLRGISSCGGNADFGAVQRVALRDQDLRAHEVDAGDHLGDRVLDLDARVHLDEEPLVACRDRRGTRPCRRCRSRSPRAICTAASQSSVRHRRSRPTAGATSTTFWWRRCTEQSRSCRCTTLPCWSPRICTSMCLARGMYFSRNTARIAEGAPASLCASSSRCVEIAGLVHHAHAASAAAERRLDDQRKADLLRDLQRLRRDPSTGSSVPGSVGTSSFCASARAAVLSPISSSSSGRGPTKVMPASRAGPREVRRSPKESRSPDGSRRRPFPSRARRCLRCRDRRRPGPLPSPI